MSHYELFASSIKSYIITKHFKRDFKHKEEAIALVLDVIQSDHERFEQLHKLEEQLKGNHIFRGKINGKHIVYAITPEHNLIFLRSFKNFKQYEEFLSDKRRILKMIQIAKAEI